MSQENAERVRRFLERAVDAPDAEWEIFDEQVDWEVGIFAMPDFPERLKGPDGVREFFRRWVAPFEEWGYDVEELIDGSDSVAVRLHQWGRGKGSGANVDGRFWQVWTMSSGKAVRVAHYREKTEALEALGLSAQDAHAES